MMVLRKQTVPKIYIPLYTTIPLIMGQRVPNRLKKKKESLTTTTILLLFLIANLKDLFWRGRVLNRITLTESTRPKQNPTLFLFILTTFPEKYLSLTPKTIPLFLCPPFAPNQKELPHTRFRK